MAGLGKVSITPAMNCTSHPTTSLYQALKTLKETAEIFTNFWALLHTTNVHTHRGLCQKNGFLSSRKVMNQDPLEEGT